MKKALISGITGQDGSYLAEFLLAKGYEVHGILRRVALEAPEQRLSRINHLRSKIIFHPATMESYSRILEIVEAVKPDECYHLAAQSFVHESFEDSFTTFNVNVYGTLHMLSAILKKSPHTKFYFAGSSEMFGNAPESPQRETTPFNPRSPYGISKVTGFHLTKNFREAYNLFACSGILFNHESPRRGFEFVTRKISSGIANIKKGKTNTLVLGNLKAKRDWGFAGDYVRAMWLMLQQPTPKDYVIATGDHYSIQTFLDKAFDYLGLTYKVVDLSMLSPQEADAQITQLQNKPNEIFVAQHPRFYRPAEVHELLGDYAKAKLELGWQPEMSFDQLVQEMVRGDLGDYILENKALVPSS